MNTTTVDTAIENDSVVTYTPPALLRYSLMATSGIFAIVFLLSAVLPMDVAVIGNGQVGVETRVKRVSHPIGGVVSEVLVHNGEHVTKGQVLLRLDNQVASADAQYSSLTVEQLLAQRARLEAERAGSGAPVFPVELRNSNSESARKAMSDESRLFVIRQQESALLRAQLRARIAQLHENVNAINAQIASLQEQRQLIEPELHNVRELWAKNLVTISRSNQLERTAVDLQGNIAAQRARLAEVMARISETQEQLIQMDASKRSQAGEELARINTTLNDQKMRRVSATDQSTRSEIRAPYSGTVEKIAFAAVGEVIRPAESIMEIVPDRDLMVLEASVSPIDIDQVKLGQSARIRFSAFNLAATPEISGRVVYVATDRSDNAETGQSYYMVRVEIDQDALRKEGLQLRSGMPAEVYIQAGERSMLSYLTKPLRDQFARAFRND